MAQPVGLYGSSGQRIADESVDRRPIPFRVGAGAHGVTGTGDHEPFLALAGACGDIAIQLPGINERIIRAVDEQHRHGGMRELCRCWRPAGTRNRPSAERTGSCWPARASPSTAAAGDTSTPRCRRTDPTPTRNRTPRSPRTRCPADRVPGSHHHFGGAHRHAVQHYPRVRVGLHDQRNPSHEVAPVKPSHADITALAQLVPAGRRCIRGRRSHIGAPAIAAVGNGSVHG